MPKRRKSNSKNLNVFLSTFNRFGTQPFIKHQIRFFICTVHIIRLRLNRTPVNRVLIFRIPGFLKIRSPICPAQIKIILVKVDFPGNIFCGLRVFSLFFVFISQLMIHDICKVLGVGSPFFENIIFPPKSPLLITRSISIIGLKPFPFIDFIFGTPQIHWISQTIYIGKGFRNSLSLVSLKTLDLGTESGKLLI